MAAATSDPGGNSKTSSNGHKPDQAQNRTELPTCEGDVQPHQGSPAVSESHCTQTSAEFPHQSQPHLPTESVATSNKDKGKLGKHTSQARAQGMISTTVKEGSILGQPFQAAEAALTGTKNGSEHKMQHSFSPFPRTMTTTALYAPAPPPPSWLSPFDEPISKMNSSESVPGTPNAAPKGSPTLFVPRQPEPYQQAVSSREAFKQCGKEPNSIAHPPLATGAVICSSMMEKNRDTTPSAQSTVRTEAVSKSKGKSKSTDGHGEIAHQDMVSLSIAESLAVREQGDRLEAVIFHVEAILGAAQHFVLNMPYRKLPLAEKFDGSTFDPNPPGSLDPTEVSQILAALKNESGGQLRSIYRDFTGRMSAPYDIPTKLISKALTRQGAESYTEKIRLQYFAEYAMDPEMKSLLPEVGTPMDHNLSAPPPYRRLAVQPDQEEDVQPIIKVEPATIVKGELATTVKAAAPGSTSGGPAKSSSTRKKIDMFTKRQKYRHNNRVLVILEASDIDIVRTHRTFMGRTLWSAKGFVWPEICMFPSDVSPESWAWMSTKLARYCPALHQSGYLVLVSGDINNCHECDHQNLIAVDVYLPAKSRINILQRGYGVNEEDQLFKVDDGTVLAQPNHIDGLTNLSRAFRDQGMVYKRGTRVVPKEVQDAVSQGKIDDLYKRKNNGNNSTVDQFLLSAKVAPKMKKRKLESRIKTALGKFDEDGTTTLLEFHANRLHHFWDMREFPDKRLNKIITNMITRVEELYKDKALTEKKFDLHLHWFIRQDVVEMMTSKTLDSLMIELTGQGDPRSKPGKLKNQIADPDLADFDLTISDLNVGGRKRKANDEARTPRARNPKRSRGEDEIAREELFREPNEEELLEEQLLEEYLSGPTKKDQDLDDDE